MDCVDPNDKQGTYDNFNIDDCVWIPGGIQALYNNESFGALKYPLGHPLYNGWEPCRALFGETHSSWGTVYLEENAWYDKYGNPQSVL